MFQQLCYIAWRPRSSLAMLRRQCLHSLCSSNIPQLAQQIINHDRLSIAQSITLLESQLATHRTLADQLFHQLNILKPQPSSTIRLGFSGAPGVGKSTLIETFGSHLVDAQKLKLAVLTVDPSSVRSGGSILGDKTRMPYLSMHPSAYIRTSPNQCDTGGVIASTFDTIRLCEYAGFDVILVETVGVGQSELAVSELVDVFVLLVAPGIGDELQGIKKGITEMANIILVNKADDPLDQTVNQTLLEYRSAMKFASSRKKVLPISGRTGRGITEAWDTLKTIYTSQADTIRCKRQEQASKWTKYVAQQVLHKCFQDYIEALPSTSPASRLADESLYASAQKLVEEWQASTRG